jgi:hypothetical protein
MFLLFAWTAALPRDVPHSWPSACFAHFKRKAFCFRGCAKGSPCSVGKGRVVAPLRRIRRSPLGHHLIKSLLLFLEFSLVIRVLRAISDFSACKLMIYRKPVQRNSQSIYKRKPQWCRRKFTGCGSLLTALVHVRSQKRIQSEYLLWIT